MGQNNIRLKQELNILEFKELMFLNKNVHDGKLKIKVHEKIPENLEETLKNAFIKAFELIFNNATAIIDKSIDKDKINLEYEVNKYRLDYKENSENLKKVDKYPKKINFVNNLFTTSVGTGMGILGLGIPDIPLFVSTILRGIYQISLSYGYDYNDELEKIYILRLIRIALSKTSSEKRMYNDELKNKSTYNYSLDAEIKETAKVMSNSLLFDKFIQGIPIIGAVGGIVNNSIYKKITDFCMIKYKKRYITDKINKKNESLNLNLNKK